jgi:hypothetical protein
MGARKQEPSRHRVVVPARQPMYSLATQFQTQFLESISRPIAGLKFPTLAESIPCNRFLSSLKVYKYRLCCCTNASTSVSMTNKEYVDAWLEKKTEKQATYQ